jgi:hypothetical protein
MFSSIFKRLTAAFMAGLMLALALAAPAARAQYNQAAAGQFNVDWVPYTAGIVNTIQLPRDNWQQLGAIQVNRPGFDRSMIEGDRWIVLGNEYAGTLGLSSDQIANTLQRFPSNAPIVVARYVPQAAQLRIQVIRVIRDAQGVQSVWVADYTPHHGEHFRAQRWYLSDTERLNPYAVGYNPFAAFRGANNDPTFYNVSLNGAQVATGLAMARFGSAMGLFVELGLQPPEVTTTSSGNIFRRTVTTTFRYFVKPNFMIATPIDMSHLRNSVTPASLPMLCPRGDGACTDAKQIAISGVVFQQLRGGNIPDIREQIYVGSDSRSSWTAFAFTLLTFAITWGMGVGMFDMSAGWSTAATGSAQGSVGASMGAAQFGAIAGGAYAGISTSLMNQSVFNAQQGWLGAMGMSPAAIPGGTVGAMTCGDRHCTGAVNNGLARNIATGIADQGGNLQATRELVTGQCAPGSTIAQCNAAGQTNGVIPRPDSFLDTNTVQAMKAREGACRNRGLVGSDLRKCIAPRADANEMLPN